MGQDILSEIRGSNFSLDWLAGHYPELSALKNIPQNPEYHGEGDVYRHTEMVCEKLKELPQWRELQKEEQELLFLAAAFHDIGKAACTKQEDGKWISPKHTMIGEKEFRRMAYREAEQFSLDFHQREMVAKLIRYHGLPVWFWKKQRPEFDLLKAAESIPLRLLYLLSKADVHDELMINQIADQCRKLIPVLAVKILDEAVSIRREFSLIKVYAADRNARDEVIQMANIFRANILDVSRETLTVAIFGDKEKTAALTRMLADFGILEIAKTGTIAIERGRSTIYDNNKLKEEYNYGKNVL